MQSEAYYKRRIDELEIEVERLKQRLKADNDNKRTPIKWKLSRGENAITMQLAARERATFEILCLSVSDQCSPNSLKVLISNLRRKLKPHGFKVTNIHGYGYAIEPRDKLKEAINNA